MNLHGLGSPSWSNFLMFLRCLFQDRFLIVLGSVFGIDLGSILASKSGPNRKKQNWFWCRFSMPRLRKMTDYSRAEEPLGDPSYACAFSKRNNEKAPFQQLFLSLFKKKAQLFLSLFRLLLTFAYHCSNYCWILSFTSSCSWSDTPWAVARRIWNL